LTGSGDWMLGASVSADGLHLATAENNGWLRVYDLLTDAAGKRSWTETKRTNVADWAGQLLGAVFTPDGAKVVAAGEYSYAPVVWDWQNSDFAYPMELGDNWIGQPAVSEDGLRVAAGDDEGQMVVWDVESEKIVATMPGGGSSSTVMNVAAVPQSGWFAEASTDGTIRLWDPDQPEAPQRTLGRTGDSPVRAVDATSDGMYLVSVSENHQIQVWRLSDGERVQTLVGPSSTNADVAFNQDGSLLAVSAADAAVHVWQWRDGSKLAVLHRHGDSVNSVEFMADGSLLTASDDSTVAIFPCTTCGPFPELVARAEQLVEAHR
jgi:WD40 repeat protein